ncbi:hypothetical protein LZ31DRAFT_80143 [Colletotrichum somersetense]|nr:hypothetical protein LZ31DRAFT_80143 [Colletotrichum somersetense]
MFSCVHSILEIPWYLTKGGMVADFVDSKDTFIFSNLTRLIRSRETDFWSQAMVCLLRQETVNRHRQQTHRIRVVCPLHACLVPISCCYLLDFSYMLHLTRFLAAGA